MENPGKVFFGYVKISVSGDQLERFLNLCRARGISMEKIRYHQPGMFTGILLAEDFFRLQPVCRKTKVHIHILWKKGIPFTVKKYRQRKCFLVGILLFAGLLFFFSSHIWNIHIEGNVLNSTPEILEFLDQQGVIHGIRKNQVNCARVASLIRKEYSDITWVSAKVEGTRLLLTIQEEVLPEESREEETACDLVADIEGKIVNIVTRRGVPQVKIGETCKKGDILVLGSIDILNDSQEVVRTEYVAADADVYVQHEIPYYREFPLAHEKKIPDGAEKSSWYLHLGNWIMGAGLPETKNYQTTVQEFPWKVTENFELPIAVGKITRSPWKTVKANYTRQQAKELAIQEMKKYEKELLNHGITITDNQISIKTDEKNCVSSGILTVVEKTGKKMTQNASNKTKIID